MNAYEDGETIVVDVMRHPRMFDTDLHGPGEGPPTLERWSIDRAAGKVHRECLDDTPQESPRIDERRIGRRYRYGYAPTVGRGLDEGDALHKHDMQRCQTITREFGAGRQAGEFVFEPHTPDFRRRPRSLDELRL